METLWARSALSEEEAVVRLERLSRGSVFSLRRWWGGPSVRCRVECVFLPCRRVDYAESVRSADGFILVNGYSRQAQWVSPGLSLSSTTALENKFPYPLSKETTLDLARKAYLSWRLGRLTRSPRDSADFVAGALVMYPYWARYAENRRGRIRLEIVDGVTGHPGGVMVKQAYLEALKSGKDAG